MPTTGATNLEILASWLLENADRPLGSSAAMLAEWTGGARDVANARPDSDTGSGFVVSLGKVTRQSPPM
jgi:hypothetical protein